MINTKAVPQLGRHVFGVAIVVSGLVVLAWPHNDDWLTLRSVLSPKGGQIFAYTAAVLQIFGGAAMQFRRSAKLGTLVLSAVFLVIVILCAPRIAAAPTVYDNWGNFFEQFSLLTGALIVYLQLSSAAPATTRRIGRSFIGLCAASFAIEQAVYLGPTETLVPKWIPPSQTFWAIATTVALSVVALALLADRKALSAARFLTLMLVSFGLFVWLPLLLSAPRSQTDWSETAETFAIAGAAWILADILSTQERNRRTRRVKVSRR